jgi:hypothetical protein
MLQIARATAIYGDGKHDNLPSRHKSEGSGATKADPNSISAQTSNTEVRQQVVDAVDADIAALQAELSSAQSAEDGFALLVSALPDIIAGWQMLDPGDIVDGCGYTVATQIECLQGELQDAQADLFESSNTVRALNAQIAAFPQTSSSRRSRFSR